MVHFLVLGFDKPPEYYASLLKQLEVYLECTATLYWLDNKSNKLNSPRYSSGVRSSSESNTFFEFSGYKTLLSELNSAVPDSGDVIILINDTATDHHFWWGWLRAIKHIITSVKFGEVYGDLRSSSGVDKRNTFIASWLFVMRADSISLLENAIDGAISNAYESVKFYEADEIQSYARHLSREDQYRLKSWLFDSNPLTGWTESCDFQKMEKETRKRKGLSIQLEHEVSRKLLLMDVQIFDLGGSSLAGRLSNIVDRLGNLVSRLWFYFGGKS